MTPKYHLRLFKIFYQLISDFTRGAIIQMHTDADERLMIWILKKAQSRPLSLKLVVSLVVVSLVVSLVVLKLIFDCDNKVDVAKIHKHNLSLCEYMNYLYAPASHRIIEFSIYLRLINSVLWFEENEKMCTFGWKIQITAKSSSQNMLILFKSEEILC